jgi:hypothetical protein
MHSASDQPSTESVVALVLYLVKVKGGEIDTSSGPDDWLKGRCSDASAVVSVLLTFCLSPCREKINDVWISSALKCTIGF